MSETIEQTGARMAIEGLELLSRAVLKITDATEQMGREPGGVSVTALMRLESLRAAIPKIRHELLG